MSLRISGSALEEPTFLELIAAQKINRTLRETFSYLLSALADRAPNGGLRLLQCDSELYLATNLLVELISLLSNGASLAESLYGLRRIPTAAEPQWKGRLSPRQKILSVLCLALLPYIVDCIHDRYRSILSSHPFAATGASTSGLQPQANEAALDTSGQSPQSPPADAPDAAAQSASAPVATGGNFVAAPARGTGLRAYVRRLALLCVDHLKVSAGLVDVAFQVAYLLKFTPHFNLGLRLSGTKLVRDNGEAAAARLAEQTRVRTHLWGQFRRSPKPSVLLRCCATAAAHFVGNNLKTVVLGSLVLFKVLEWWFMTGEEELEAAKRVVPPPPPPYARHPDGIALSSNRAVCPLCGRERRAPSLLAVSGYVFCYQCIFRHVEVEGRCPVTLIPADLNHIRRLFLTS